MFAVPGALESSGGLRCAEALGGTPVLPAVQPEIQSHSAAALPRMLLQSGRNAPQVGNRHLEILDNVKIHKVAENKCLIFSLQ